MFMTELSDSLILKAAADEEHEAAADEENNKEEEPEEKENDSKPDKPADAGTDAVHDNGGNELPETRTVKDTVLSESAADAGTADKNSEPSGDGNGERSSTEENESGESSGGEKADNSDESGRGNRDHESENDRRGSSGVAETEGERETESEPKTESEPETSSETGTEDGTEPVNRKDSDYYIKSLVEKLSEMGYGTEPETETAETDTETEAETSVMHEDLQQVHTDLQVICCFIVVFLVILLCDYIYKFFRIFF